MRNLGITVNNFNPQILYVIHVKHDNDMLTKYHCHDYLEFSYILSGSVTYKIENEIYSLKEGDLLPFNPGVYHSEMIKGDANLQEIHFGFNNINIRNLPNNYVTRKGFSGVFNFEKYDKEFQECCYEIIREQREQEAGYELILKCLSMKIFTLFLREMYSGKLIKEAEQCHFESSEKSNIVKEIVAYMNENYMNNISLDKISKNMYLSSVYISKIFKEETGMSPINYLIKIRLDKAQNMLVDTDLSVKAIAKSVGYGDAYYFSKLFKKYYNCSPLYYKRNKI